MAEVAGVDALIAAARASDRTHQRLTELCDKFGHRLSGSDALNEAAKYCAEAMKADGLENVTLQPVMVTHWVRGEESVTMTMPRELSLTMLGIGRSVGTPAGGLEAAVVAFRSWDAFEAASDEAIGGNIVLFNEPFTTYGENVSYRLYGASRAAARGAVAALVRSVTPVSLDTAHTGTLIYSDDAPRIPAACLTIEGAELLTRLCEAGESVRVKLHMEAAELPPVESFNVIAEVRGREKPEEVVVLGGHLDTWDVGPGPAHDDTQGCCVAWEVLRLALHNRPRRTLRAVFWADEELGQTGSVAYADSVAEELAAGRIVAAIESDMGCAKAIGFAYSGDNRERLQSLLTCLEGEDAHRVVGEDIGMDVRPLAAAGVPALLLRLNDDWWFRDYFHYHHTTADTVDKVDAELLKHNVAVVGGCAWALADADKTLLE